VSVQPQATPSEKRRRLRRPRLETLLAILVGVVLGLAIVSAFVFAGSEGSIDAPRISGVDTGKPAGSEPAAPEPAHGASGKQPPAQPQRP